MSVLIKRLAETTNKHMKTKLTLLYKTATSIYFLFTFTFVAIGQDTFFRQAVPVWVSDRQTTKNLTVSFRANFGWDGKGDILFRIAAHADYRAYVNGIFLGHGPCVAGYGFYRVDEYQLKKLIKTGENIIAIEVAGYNVDNYYLMNQPSFLQAEITSGDKVLAITSTQLKKSENPRPVLFEAAIFNQRVQDVPKYSFQRTYMEAYKLTPQYNAWMTDKQALFKKVALERTNNKQLIPRRVKYPDYSIRKYRESLPGGIYKFECNSTGFIGAEVQVTSPSKITFAWDEILTNGDVDIHRLSCNNSITYELQPGQYTLETFEPYTLQYLKVETEGDCSVGNFYIRQYVNGDVSQAKFTCSDEKINSIFAAAVETYKQNALDIFMDCPSRERAGWLCDSYFTSRVAFDLSGNTLIEKNFLENFLLPDKFRYIPQGMLPMCYPADHSNGNFIPNWAMWFVLELEEYLGRSGDRKMVNDLRPKVMALLDYFKEYENEDGLLEKLEKWIFVEWSKANEFVQDVNYPTNMLYARMLESVASLYHLPELRTKARHIQQVIRKQSFDGNFFIDNAVREGNKLVAQKNNRTETCQYYAFFFGIATPETYPDLWRTLLSDFGPKRKVTKAYPEIYPSNAFVGNYLRLEILSQYGYVRQLLSESIDEYAYMADLTGTLWENTTTVASCNHGFASHVAHVFYRDLLGIKRVDAISKQVEIVFNDTDLQSCSGTIPIGNQKISLQWEKKGKKLSYQLNIPADYRVSVKNNTRYQLVQL